MSGPPDLTYLIANLALVVFLWIAAGAAVWAFVPVGWPLRALMTAVAAVGLLFFEYHVLMRPVCRLIDAAWPKRD